MKNLEAVEVVTASDDGEKEEAVAEIEGEAGEGDVTGKNMETSKEKDRDPHYASTIDVNSVDERIELVSSERDQAHPAQNSETETAAPTESNGNGFAVESEEETTMNNTIIEDSLINSSNFELSKSDRDDSVVTEKHSASGNNGNDKEEKTDSMEMMEVTESPEKTSAETLPYAKEGSPDPEDISSEREKAKETLTRDKYEQPISDEDSSDITLSDIKVKKSLGETENKLSNYTENKESKKDKEMFNSRDSSIESSRDNCMILMCSFVDQSPAKEKLKETEEKTTEKEVVNTISLEPASPDAGASETVESEEDLDINAGLEKCFSALEKKIDNEAESSGVTSDEKEEEEEKERHAKERSSDIEIPIHDVDDDDDM